VPSAGIVAALLLFSSCALIGVGLARDGGSGTPWSSVPLIGVSVTALLGPLVHAPMATSVCAVAMVVTAPPVRARAARHRSRTAAAQLSDWSLEARWVESGRELGLARGCPERALPVVLQRAELLDELLRRRDGARDRA
jgi:hypothetical protein